MKVDKTAITILKTILEEQKKQTKILQTIASSLKDNGENRNLDVDFLIDGASQLNLLKKGDQDDRLS